MGFSSRKPPFALALAEFLSPFSPIVSRSTPSIQGSVRPSAGTSDTSSCDAIKTNCQTSLFSLSPPPTSAMSKRVHFAPTNTVYSSSGSEPSPSLTISSLPSSSSPDLPTPPPEEDDDYQPSVYPRTPYATNIDLYPDVVIPKQMQIHFLLAFTPYLEPAFHYDLSRPPTNADYPAHAFSEPATSPPMPSLTITSPFLKFNIEVTPSSPTHGAYVTVTDVLLTLYRELRLAIHPIEYAELSDGEIKQGVDAAYYVRCGRIRDPDERAREEKKGIKKIDLLMGNTRFMGLSGTLSGPDVWELNVA
ncbi:hypothetical protein BDZ97DRAFT_1400172 [Flammula alnicola]|nr:hypothetical protein BDZ97DRAFT_1400172 [Flammula alnicola]